MPAQERFKGLVKKIIDEVPEECFRSKQEMVEVFLELYHPLMAERTFGVKRIKCLDSYIIHFDADKGETTLTRPITEEHRSEYLHKVDWPFEQFIRACHSHAKDPDWEPEPITPEDARKLAERCLKKSFNTPAVYESYSESFTIGLLLRQPIQDSRKKHWK